ncbi:DgyrCDS7400 [Dimorphilus gyrociliatus]|uniref:DgyrCDS7400 n=1 Tax=Dimorphilus gyrociliatus TaxID=2664684 RepID=A0A7I8VR29_9ANNE|nr:DgyrCDS7400 [Dimorphilus gyrociliatus]
MAHYSQNFGVPPKFLSNPEDLKQSVLEKSLLKITPVAQIQKRLKGRKGIVQKKKLDKQSATEDDEDPEDTDDEEDDEDSDDENEYSRIFFEEDKSLPNNFREIISQQSSMRLDSILSSGLNTPRSKVDDYFLGSQLRLNGDRVLKKSAQMSEGDYVDIISDVKDKEMRVKRVRVVKILHEKTASGKRKVVLRCWRQNVTISRF